MFLNKTYKGLSALTLALFVLAGSPLVVTATSENLEIQNFSIGKSHESSETLKVKGVGSEPTYKLGEIHEDQLSDIVTIAEQEGAEPADIAKEVIDGELFSIAVGEISEQFSDIYIVAMWLGKDDNPQIRLNSYPDKGVIEILEKLNFDVELVIGEQWLNDTERTIYSGLAVRSVVEALGNQISAQSEINEFNQDITVTYANDPNLNSKLDPKLVEEFILNNTKAETLPVKINFIYNQDIWGIAEPQYTVRGGKSLRNSSNVNVCTSGFSVTRNGVQGIITAEHCPNSLNYGGYTGVIGGAIPAPASPFGWDWDLQFHKRLSGHVSAPTFRADSGTNDIREVKSTVNAPIGINACVYGITTKKKKCAAVVAVSQCIFYSTPVREYCGLVAVKSNITNPGDSGGPWFNGRSAKGTHTGTIYVNNILRSAMTAQSAKSSLNLQYMIAP